jgi:hypothetical protein
MQLQLRLQHVDQIKAIHHGSDEHAGTGCARLREVMNRMRA